MLYKKKPRKGPRNPTVIPARQRNGGPMKDKREPRGGNRNEQKDLLEEFLEIFDDLMDEGE